MVKRRKFIQQLGGGVIGSTFIAGLPFKVKAELDWADQLKKSESEEEYWGFVREQFPVVKEKVYFNCATMGPSPYQVVEKVKSYITYMNRYGEYHGAEEARESLAKFINAKTEEISLTHNTTEGINIVAWGLPLKKGDEVITTTHEHVGNALPWLNRAKLDGIVLKPFSPATTADENLNRINDLITSKTKVIAVPHITCTTGLILPVKEIAKLGHDKGLFVFFDGAHGSGSTLLDMKDIGADFYASCCHKWLLGPNGTGYLYIKEALLDILQAYWVGAYSDTGWKLNLEEQSLQAYVPTAHRYDFGTQSAALYQGVVAAVDFLSNIGMEKVHNRVRKLASYLHEKLLNIEDKVEMLSAVEDRSRGSMVGFRLKNIDFQKFGGQAMDRKFRVRTVAESGLNSIRISTHIFNTYKEIDDFVGLIEEVG